MNEPDEDLPKTMLSPKGDIRVELTNDALSIGAASEWVKSSKAGAVVIFAGKLYLTVIVLNFDALHYFIQYWIPVCCFNDFPARYSGTSSVEISISLITLLKMIIYMSKKKKKEKTSHFGPPRTSCCLC